MLQILLTILCRSSQGGPDWTCILVGFSSGYLRVFTEVRVLNTCLTLFIYIKLLIYAYFMHVFIISG